MIYEQIRICNEQFVWIFSKPAFGEHRARAAARSRGDGPRRGGPRPRRAPLAPLAGSSEREGVTFGAERARMVTAAAPAAALRRAARRADWERSLVGHLHVNSIFLCTYVEYM